MTKLTCVVVAALVFNACESSGQVSVDAWWEPGSFYDLGDIASDGSGGQHSVVREQEAGEGGGFNYYYGESPFSAPPATPPQEQFVLSAGEELALTLPQLSHAPHGATVSVVQSIAGNQIEVDARIHFLGWSTDWLPPPNEYIHSLGAFPAGDYRVIVNLSRTNWIHPDEPAVSRGFIDFSVTAVPEPTAALLAALATALATSLRRARAGSADSRAR